MRILWSILLILLFVPGWTGAERLPLLDRDGAVRARTWTPESGWPRLLGALEPVGALALSSYAPAFGGFSAIAIRNGRASLLSDGGNLLHFAVRGGRLQDVRSSYLPDGPGTGWEKQDRDSESMALDPATGQAWVGFERANAIWRYSARFGRAEAFEKPRAMANWRMNSGAESLVRLRDGRFIVIAERAQRRGARRGLIFSGDPTALGTTVSSFGYRPPKGYDPSDAALLPNGDLLILNRGWRFPLTFSAKITLIPRVAIRPGVMVTGREIATLPSSLVSENCEGLAITREKGRTMLWIVTDNDTMPVRRTLLMKFRLRV
ncbi:esterase-like activity of phytase family protein [Sphingomonas sp. SUN019]|uniref:esterase-like activity of phytase family protein n=1 Tax=Sphingomonas sp. SUN019 TaxID=2937788 RepID=UPI0021644F76|nr:esterase-like activity of phytase family protein [Sphingomonas sp. SUN019]UVO52311.1 esterase-like activity of phytase family protein [Sphingomonas sp. SUN019]